MPFPPAEDPWAKKLSTATIRPSASCKRQSHNLFSQRPKSPRLHRRAAALRQFLCKKTPAAWQKRREPSAVTKPRAQGIVDAYFSREHFDDRDSCCPLLGTSSDVQRRGEVVKAAYQEVVEQLVKVFEDHPNGPRARERALALVALCVGGMVLARNVCHPDLADDFSRTAHAEVRRTAGWT